MKENVHVLGFWSANDDGITGQAIVTRRVVGTVLPKLGAVKDFSFPAGLGLKPFLQWIRAIAQLWYNLVSKRIDCLYLVCSRSNVGFLRDTPALLAGKFGLRIVAHAHGSDIADLLSFRYFSFFARWLYHDVVLITPSDHLLGSLKNAGVVAAEVCENFYDPPAATDISTIRTEAVNVLWNSNILASKGFFTLVDGVKEARRRGAPIELVVLGAPTGDDEMSYATAKERLEELKNDAHVKLIGSVSPEMANLLLHNSDIVALPSRYKCECQPLSIIAAMCAGASIIAADSAALRATLRNYPASFVNSHSAIEIADVLISYFERQLGSPIQRNGPAAQIARTRFSTLRFDEEMTVIFNGCKQRSWTTAQRAPTRASRD